MNAMEWSVNQLARTPSNGKTPKEKELTKTMLRVMPIIVDFVRDHPRCTIENMISETGEASTTIKRASKELLNEGRIVRVLVGNAYFYSLPA